jgi:prolactin regulatory element-binding protein
VSKSKSESEMGLSARSNREDSRKRQRSQQRKNQRKFSFPIYSAVFFDRERFLIAGGGGKKSSGIRNLVALAEITDDLEITDCISAVTTDDDAPQRLAMHPDGDCVVCVFGGSVGVFKCERNVRRGQMVVNGVSNTIGKESNGNGNNSTNGNNDDDGDNEPAVNLTRAVEFPRRVALTADDRDVKCCVFAPSGRRLAIGLETGEVKILIWPSLEVEAEMGAHESGSAVTDIAWSPDERIIVSCAAERIGNSSSQNHQQQQQQQQQQQNQNNQNETTKGAIVWSVERGERIRALPDPTSLKFNCKGFPSSSRKANSLKVFRGASFSQTGDFFFCGVNIDGVGYLVKFETTTWQPIATVRAFRDSPISAYSANQGGSRHACGSAEGDVVAFDGGGLRKASSMSSQRKMRRIAAVRGAHMIFVTTICWNARGDVVLSGSADASVYCLHVKNKFKSGCYGTIMRMFLWISVYIACLIAWVFMFIKVFVESPPALNEFEMPAAEEAAHAIDVNYVHWAIQRRSSGYMLTDDEEKLFHFHQSNIKASKLASSASDSSYGSEEYSDEEDRRFGTNNAGESSRAAAVEEWQRQQKLEEEEEEERQREEQRQEQAWKLQRETELKRSAFEEEEEKKRQQQQSEDEGKEDEEETLNGSDEDNINDVDSNNDANDDEATTTTTTTTTTTDNDDIEEEAEKTKAEEQENEDERDTEEAIKDIEREMAEERERKEDSTTQDDVDQYATDQNDAFEWDDNEDEEDEDDINTNNAEKKDEL